MKQNKGPNRFRILKDMTAGEQAGIALIAAIGVAGAGMVAAAPVVMGMGAAGGIAATGAVAIRAARKKRSNLLNPSL